MTAKVIYNPYAGRWTALKKKGDAESALAHCGIHYDLSITECIGHGIQLAEQAVFDGFSPIIAAGGDGTINEVVNGMMSAVKHNDSVPPLGFLPLGTANDKVVNLGQSQNLIDSAMTIASGKTRLIDICQVNQRYFINNSGMGLEPYITTIQERYTRLRGIIRYLVATLKGILDNPKWTMHLQWEGDQYRGPVTLVSVGNSPRTGGIFYMTPNANPFDGLLTFAFGFVETRREILRILPKTMKAGKGNYTEEPQIFQFESPWLKVTVNPSTPLHTDGEIVSRTVEKAEYKVHPAKMPVLLNSPNST